MTKDTNILNIENLIRSILPGCRIILFGSRGKGVNCEDSDYDVMVITPKELMIREKQKYASLIRSALAKKMIDIDIIIKTETDVEYYKDKIGSIVNSALADGISL